MRGIQCKRCFFFKPEWCPKKQDSPDPDLIRDCQYFRTKTNADHIRSMTDEELARFMWNRDIDIVEKASKVTGFTYTVDMEKCFENVLNWLKQECGS